MAAINFYVGFYHLAIFIKGKRIPEHLPFSLVCFCVGLYDLFSYGLYNSQSILQGIFWERLQLNTVDFISIFIIWFVTLYTKQYKNKIIGGYLILFIILLITSFFINSEYTLTPLKPAIKNINIGNIIHITYYEGEVGILYTIGIIASISAYFYLLYLLIRYYLKNKNKNKNILIIIGGQLIYFIGVINDSAVTSKLYTFIYVSEYTFLILVLCMAYVLLCDYINLNKIVEEMNINLEKKVIERTNELHEANKKISAALDKLWGEMELAKKIQTVLLPQTAEIPGYEISAYLAPAKNVSGDYYDIINTADMDWLIIGDVSGHGISAGLVMMMVHTAIHNTLNQNPDIKPTELLRRVNSTICNNLKRMNEILYMTINIFAVGRNGVFTFTGMHQDILIFRIHTGQIEIINTNGIWIGITGDIDDKIENNSFSVNPGDTLLLYTDGLIEANLKSENNVKDQNTMFGFDKMVNIFQKNANNPPQKIIQTLIKELEKNYTADDDVTLLAITKL